MDDITPVTNSVSIIESQERAQIDILISTAKRYPRNIATVKQRMLEMACHDVETAEACNYHLERDGHSIDGPSIRLAEIAVYCFGNIRAGAHIVSNDGRIITARAYCHDLENNVFVALDTERRITDKRGRTYSEDMQVVTANAAKSIAYRNVVFKVIPGALIQGVSDDAKKFAVGDFKTLTQRVTRALKKFASIGVNEARVLALLGRASVTEVTVEDVQKLFGVFTAIKDGTTTVEDQFPVPGKVMQPNISKVGPDPSPTREDVEALREAAAHETPKPFDEEMLPKPPKNNGKQAKPSTTLQEIEARLLKDGISQRRFVKTLHGFRMVDGDPETIELKDIDERNLKAALRDWQSVIENLPAE
jgi:hypothetical protein